jgi:hypothetical protein
MAVKMVANLVDVRCLSADRLFFLFAVGYHVDYDEAREERPTPF